MVRKLRDKSEPHLTDVELELMSILWARGEGTVRDVLALLPKERDLAYTSVSTILRILEQKGTLTSRKVGQTHVYVPALTKAAYEEAALRQLVTTVFDNTPSSLVARLIDGTPMSKDELLRIRKVLDERMPP